MDIGSYKEWRMINNIVSCVMQIAVDRLVDRNEHINRIFFLLLDHVNANHIADFYENAFENSLDSFKRKNIYKTNKTSPAEIVLELKRRFIYFYFVLFTKKTFQKSSEKNQ